MPYPEQPSKHRWESLFTASDFHRYVAARSGRPPSRPPPKVVMVFGSRWRRYLPRRFPSTFDRYSGVYRASAKVGVALVDGPGAPFATIVLEELAALGVERFVIVGLAGSLRSGIAAGSVVLCTKALRDEGTSYHYQGPAKYAHPDRPLTNS